MKRYLCWFFREQCPLVLGNGEFIVLSVNMNISQQKYNGNLGQSNYPPTTRYHIVGVTGAEVCSPFVIESGISNFQIVNKSFASSSFPSASVSWTRGIDGRESALLLRNLKWGKKSRVMNIIIVRHFIISHSPLIFWSSHIWDEMFVPKLPKTLSLTIGWLIYVVRSVFWLLFNK